MANEPRINLALVGEMPANPVRGTVYMSPDTSGNFIKVGVDGSVRTIFDGSNYVLKEESPWAPGEGEGTAVLKQGESEAIGEGAVAHGNNTDASGNSSHSEGTETHAYGDYSHAEGRSTQTKSNHSHAEGENTKTDLNGYGSHAEGYSTLTISPYSHAEGFSTGAKAICSHAEGSSTNTYGPYSHTEGINTMTRGDYSHAEGNYTTAYGDYSHAEGVGSNNTDYIQAKRAGDSNSFIYITAQPHNLYINDILVNANLYARVINILNDTTFEVDSNAAAWKVTRTTFSKVYIVDSNIAYSSGSHAEGNFTTAIGQYSHAEGYKTVTTNTYEHAQGMFNISHANTLFSIGNGNDVRSNAFEIMQNGNAYLYGVASFDGQTLSNNNTLQYFLNIRSINEGEYFYIFGSDIPEIPFSAYLNRLHLYIDDWPDDKIEEIMEDIGASTLEDMYNIIYDANVNNTPDYSPTAYCNEYVYEDTVEIDGTLYYLWYDGDHDMYAIMDTSMTMERLENISKYHDPNADESPFVAIVTDDLQVRYDETTSRTVNKGYQLACYKIDEE